MRSWPLLLAGAAIAILVASSLIHSPQPAVADSALSTVTLSSDETGLVAAINARRIADGLVPLAVDPALTQVARERSTDQAESHYFSHTAPDGHTVFDLLSADGIGWVYGGENLAESRGTDPVQAAISGFMQSSAHRDNVLGARYARVGVGAAQTSDATIILTVVFTD